MLGPTPRILLATATALTVYLGTVTRAGVTFVVEETTIAQVHAGFQTGALTCRDLVTRYLARIERYNDRGPELRAIASVNPRALPEADRLDREFAKRGLTGPLHCVPVILKDNILTAGWETTAGSPALKGFIPDRDAAAVVRLKAAGAILLAKSNMPDLALDMLNTVSALYGSTRNPYALDRVPAGSSGGTAVAVAANLGLVGLGTDTGGSIRGPAAHASVVGVRPTFGLNSRDGIVPLDPNSDTVGPIARRVEDAALVLDVLVGWDEEDTATEAIRRLGNFEPSSTHLQDGFKDTRIGVLRQAYLGGPLKIDPQIARLFTQALDNLSSLGVKVVDSVTLGPVPNLPEMEKCRGFRYNLNEFLAALGPNAPIRSFDDIVSSGRYHPSLQSELRAMQTGTFYGPDSNACRDVSTYRDAVADILTSAMNRLDLDVLVYPTWSQLPQRSSEVALRTSGQTLRFASATGFPAVTIPMGFSTDGLPSGLSLLGRKGADADLLRIAYAFEQATGHRRPPVAAPPIRVVR
jgi:Asp-tRNA(Asn)/Glu-tRNA(Gln) amidotransferase A subunit family amidase